MSTIPDNERVLVKFGATWCSSCKQLSRVIVENPPMIPVIEIDIDDEPELAQQYNIRGLPTTVLVDSGKEVKRVIGNLTAQQLKNLTE